MPWERFEVHDDQDKHQKQRAGRKLLVLGIVSIVTGTILFIVVLTIIIKYEEDKRVSGSADGHSQVLSGATSASEYPTSAFLQPSFPMETLTPLSSIGKYNPTFSSVFSSYTTDSIIQSDDNKVISKDTDPITGLSSHISPSFSSAISLSEFSAIDVTSSTLSTDHLSHILLLSSSSVTPLLTEDISLLSQNINSSTISVYQSRSASSLSSIWITQTTSLISSSAVTCGLDQYQCDNNACIHLSNVCDGMPDCLDSSDESPNCECSNAQFRCQSSQCVSKSAHCDRFTQCQDGTDEYNCTNCIGFECGTGLCLWTWTAHCNGIVDCVDLSDEKQCPFKPGFRRCNNGLWVKSDDWCNGIDNCYDNSDETNCRDCGPSEIMCISGQCIRQEWLCDGHIDCINGTDEDNCSKCGLGEFTCRDYTCITQEDVCDGLFDCADKSDEEHCVKLEGPNITNGLITLTLRGSQGYICSELWSSENSDTVCRLLGYGSSLLTFDTPVTNVTSGSLLLQLTQSTLDPTESLLRNFQIVASCDTDTLISVTCMPKECGERKENLVMAFIVGGNLAVLGRWPWVASLSYLGKPICGAALISDQWVVTAGHCITIPGSYDYSQVPFYIEVMLGSTKRSRDSLSAVTVKSDRIISHPNLTWTGLGPIYMDIALIHLERPVRFSDFIQPICLPLREETYGPHSNCYLAGWGLIGSNQDKTVNDLREAKLNIWNDTECQKDRVPLESAVPVNITLCAGYRAGILSGCQGDSGGPLMCQDTRGHWTVAGIMSSGPASCGIASTSSDRFTKVSAFRDWIRNVTSL